ncbi:MAG: hypothetical protein ACUZ8E_16360 [Candidatus Anammoxibacter sp.]
MKILFVAVFLVLLSFTVNAEETNYCHDQEANRAWEVLMHKYPGDSELSTLHALRMGLCYKIETGDIVIKEATKIFESVKNQLINKKANENGVKRKKAKL